jgi:hypothetical protein
MELSVLFSFLGMIAAGVSAGFTWLSLRKKLSARSSLIKALSQDLAFIQEVSRLNFADPLEKQTICELEKRIATHLAELEKEEQKLLEESLRQPSNRGRIRYIQSIVRDVDEKVHQAA